MVKTRSEGGQRCQPENAENWWFRRSTKRKAEEEPKGSAAVVGRTVVGMGKGSEKVSDLE